MHEGVHIWCFLCVYYKNTLCVSCTTHPHEQVLSIYLNCMCRSKVDGVYWGGYLYLMTLKALIPGLLFPIKTRQTGSSCLGWWNPHVGLRQEMVAIARAFAHLNSTWCSKTGGCGYLKSMCRSEARGSGYLKTCCRCLRIFAAVSFDNFSGEAKNFFLKWRLFQY